MKRSFSFVAVLALLVPAALRAQCTKDTDCKGDRLCVDGKCQAAERGGCRADVDCPGEQVCEKGRCQDTPGIDGQSAAPGDDDRPVYDPAKAPTACQGPGYRVASIPGARKLGTTQPAEVCRFIVEDSADTTLSLTRSAAVPSLEQAVAALGQLATQAGQRQGSAIETDTLSAEVSGFAGQGVALIGRTDPSKPPRVVLMLLVTAGPATYLLSVDGPKDSTAAVLDWLKLFIAATTLDPKAPAPTAPAVARPVLRIPAQFEPRRVEELGLQWEVFAGSQVEDRSQDGKTHLAFVHPSLPGVGFEVVYTMAAFAPAKVASETLKSLKQDLTAQGATFKARSSSRKVAGRKAHGFVFEKLALPQQEPGYRETLLVNHGDLLFIATVVSLDQDKAIAHRALGALLDRVRFFAPVINYNTLLRGRYDYLGNKADNEVLTFDGDGGVERYFAAASHMMPNGTFFQSSGRTTEGSYSVRDGQVTLDVGEYSWTCDLVFAQDRSVLKLDCGGYWYIRK
ncbi:MAG: dickkopf-related protein [Pseudomonadota bacterium]